MEERLDIGTPEGVVFGYQVAGIGSRFMAALADMIVLVLLLLAFSCAATVLINMPLGLEGWMAVVPVLLSFALIWGYYIFFELAWNGQSPGKRWAGLRVIRSDGTPLTLVDSLIRNLVRFIDFLPLFYAVGLLTMFLNAQARRLGDYAAGTLVVREQRDVTLHSLTHSGWYGSPTLSEADQRLVAGFLERRHELRNRGELALRIASAVAARQGLPQPNSVSEAEELLTRLARKTRQQ